jgi:hypothetical protein
MEKKSEAVGAEIKRLSASPFYEKILEVDQLVRANQGKVVGLRVEELVVEPRLLPAEDLLFLALVHPAKALRRADPTKQIVILVDALDEIRYHATAESILTWFTHCSEFPENIRFVMTSRPPDEELKLFCEKQRRYLSELAIAGHDENVRKDLQLFIGRWVSEPAVAPVLRATEGGAELFVQKVTDKACGNLGYVDALARGIDQALLRKNSKTIQALLALRELPGDLEGLYAFFLHQIKASVARERVELKDPETGETYDKPVWPAVYDRMLGVLAVAMEPLDLDHMMRLGGINADPVWVNTAIERLLQFLQTTGDRYRLYHATVADFLTSESTRTNPKTKDLYQDPQQRHKQIANYYWQNYHEDWEKCHDAYGLNHLSAHLATLRDGQRLRALVSEKWMLARRRQGPQHGIAGFIDDIARASITAMAEAEGDAKVIELFRLQTARHVVSHQTTVHSDKDLQTLVWLGRVGEAIALCRLRSPPDARYHGLQAILRALNQVVEVGAPARLPDKSEVDKWERQLLKEAELAARAIRGDDQRAKAMAEVAVGFERMGDPRADALLDEAKQIALDRYVFEDTALSPVEGGKVGVWAVRDVVEILVKADRFEQAETLACSVFGSKSLFHELFRTAASALATAGKVVEAERVARTLGSPEALSDVVVVLTEAGQFQEAERIARSIEPGQEQFRALSAVAAGLAQANDERATKLFDELQQTMEKLAGIDRSEFLLTLSMAFVKAARCEDAEKVIRSILHTARRAEAFIGLARALAKDGDVRATATFDEAVAATRAMEDKSRQADKAETLVEALVEARAFAKAEEISCTLLPEGWQRAQALRKIALGLASVGDSSANEAIDSAWRAARAVEDPRLRALSLFELALVIGRSGDQRMNDLLSETKSALNKVADDRAHLDELSGMANALAQKGLDCAAPMLDYVIGARRELAGDKEPDLRQIAVLLIQANRHAEAEHIARLILNPKARAEVLRTLGEALAAMPNPRSNRVLTEALKATESIPALTERAQARGMLVQTLARWKALRPAKL